MAEQIEAIDYAVAAFLEDDEWQVEELTDEVLEDVDSIAHALRHLAADDGALGLVAVDEDFFVLVRVDGPSTKVLLSDVTAADEWELASSAVDFLGLPDPDDDDAQVPAGDLDILHDLGLGAPELAALLDDVELYPDDVLSDVARRVGFGAEFDDAAGLTSA